MKCRKSRLNAGFIISLFSLCPSTIMVMFIRVHESGNTVWEWICSFMSLPTIMEMFIHVVEAVVRTDQNGHLLFEERLILIAVPTRMDICILRKDWTVKSISINSIKPADRAYTASKDINTVNICVHQTGKNRQGQQESISSVRPCGQECTFAFRGKSDFNHHPRPEWTFAFWKVWMI